MDTQNWPKNEWEDIYHGLQEISRKMENIMFNCVDDIDAKRFAQDCYDDIETWMDNCARKGNFKVETLDLTSSKKPIKSDYKGLDDEVGDLQIDMTNTGYFEDGWLRIEGENEEGYRDGTEFTINAYGPNGEDLGSKKFDFLELWHKGPITSSKKPIKSADKHYKYDEYLGNIYDSDENNKDYWTREEYGEMVEKARDIFYPAVQKAANACRFTVSDNEAEYVAEKCVRQFFDNTSWDEAVNRPEEYYVNSSKKSIESAMPGREKGIRAIMDEYGCSWEEAEEIMNEGIESACHDKSKKSKKKPEKIEQTRRARNTESLNNLYGKMFS